MPEYITDDIKSSSNDFYEEKSDEENSNKDNSLEETKYRTSFGFIFLNFFNSSLYIVKKSSYISSNRYDFN